MKTLNEKNILLPCFFFLLGFIAFIVLSKIAFKNENPIKIYIDSYVFLCYTVNFLKFNPRAFILLAVPFITIVSGIMNVLKNSKLITFLNCLCLFMFQINQFIIYLNVQHL